MLLLTANLTNAITRARAYKPKVHVLGLGMFNVQSSELNDWFYSVTFDGQGEEITGKCDCACGKHDKYACKHIAAAAPIYLKQLKDAEVPEELCAECQLIAPAHCETELCHRCIEATAASPLDEPVLYGCRVCGGPTPPGSDTCAKCQAIGIILDNDIYG